MWVRTIAIHFLKIPTILFQGDDPMRNVVCFLLVVFGMYPDLQKKAAQEVYDVVGPIPNKVELCDLDKLTYMDMCIKEVLRLFPIAPYIMRESSEDFKIGIIHY